MFKVIPVSEYQNSLNQCFLLSVGIAHCFVAIRYTPKKILARKNRQNAKVNGGILVSDHLKIGEAHPQMTLAMIRAKIPFWTEFTFDFNKASPCSTQGEALRNTQSKFL